MKEKERNTNKRLYFSFSTIILALVLLLGVTYALLSEEVEFTENFIKTGNVKVSTTLSYKDNVVDNIQIDKLHNGQSYEYTVDTINESNLTLAYRYIIEFEEDYRILNALNISLDNKDFNFDNNHPRATTSWVHGITNDFNNALTFSLPKWYSTNKQEECRFVLKLQVVQDNFVEVENHKQLNDVVDGEFVKLSKDFKEENITISGKSIYLDLNDNEFDCVSARDGATVEVENGEVDKFINDSNAIIYYNDSIELDDEIEDNLEEELYLDNKRYF